MRITCPHCGERGHEEFAYLGDARRARPAPDAAVAAWAEYVYLRDNPAGRHEEYWYHASGCQAWLRVTRDTRTHEVLAVAATRDEAA
jgi:sarcosine oxidase subunit delta